MTLIALVWTSNISSAQGSRVVSGYLSWTAELQPYILTASRMLVISLLLLEVVSALACSLDNSCLSLSGVWHHILLEEFSDSPFLGGAALHTAPDG